MRDRVTATSDTWNVIAITKAKQTKSRASGARIPIEIISVIQGMVIIFVAAPDIIRWLYHIRASKAETTVLTRGWGQ